MTIYNNNINMSYQVLISTIIDSINEFLVSIQNDQLPTECPTGTVDDINVTCENYVYNGTYGNKTKTGYYVTYSLSITEIQNLYNFQLVYSGADLSYTEVNSTTAFFSNNTSSAS